MNNHPARILETSQKMTSLHTQCMKFTKYINRYKVPIPSQNTTKHYTKLSDQRHRIIIPKSKKNPHPPSNKLITMRTIK